MEVAMEVAMEVIIFGATGYLGSHVAQQLINSGHNVTCLVRLGSNTAFLEAIGANITAVDFNQLQSHQALIDTGTIVINCVADTRSHASYNQRKVVEIELTRKLFEIAQRRNAKRFIQLSTVMVYGFDRPPEAIDESYPPNPKYIYSQIAIDREKTLLSMAPNAETELVIVRPSNTFGERDISFLPSFLKSHNKGAFPVVSGGKWRFSCMDARDVGRAFVHLLSVNIKRAEIYLIKGFDTDWLSFKQELDDVMGTTSKVFNMQKHLMMNIARLLEAVFPFGTKPPMTRFNLEVLSTTTVFDDSKIRATGFSPQYSLKEGLIHVIK